MAESVSGSAALEASVRTNRAVQVVDGFARLIVCDDANDATGGYIAGENPRLRFTYKVEVGNTDTFTVGFREAGATTWASPACETELSRDGVVKPTAPTGGTGMTGTVDYQEHDGFVTVVIKPATLEAFVAGTGTVEIAIDTEGLGDVVLYDFRYDPSDEV